MIKKGRKRVLSDDYLGFLGQSILKRLAWMMRLLVRKSKVRVTGGTSKDSVIGVGVH